MRTAFVCTLLLFFPFIVPSAVAQVTSSSISGRVVDAADKPIVNAQVTAIDLLRGFTFTAHTNTSGNYRLIGVPPGNYSISASANGFGEHKVENVGLVVDAVLTANFKLPLAMAHETVEVSSQSQPLETKFSELADVMSQHWIDTLPLNRRDFLQLALLTAGALPAVEGSELSARGGVAMHVNGGREEYNNFLLDGVDNNDPYVNRYSVQPSMDSVQEFKIATNSYSPEYGRNGAGQVNVVTRRGTNGYHGTLYEYLRNRVFDESNYFDGPDKTKFIRNQFGFNVGGPLRRNRTFFFVATDFLREREGISRLFTVPTTEQLGGNLSSLGVTIIDPFTRNPFSGNIIPSDRISAVSKQIGNLFPAPNRSGIGGNYLTNVVQRDDETQGNYRLDHRFSEVDDFTARYSFGLAKLFEPFAEGTDTIPGFGDYVDDHTQNAMLYWQHVFGARSVNSIHMGYNRYSRDLLPQNYMTDVGKLWNVAWINVPQRDFGFPSMTIAGFSKIGDTPVLPILRHTNTFQLSDDLSISRGAHLFKIGFDIRDVRLTSHLNTLTRGSLSFSGFISGSGLSDFLLGFPSFGLQAQANNLMHLRMHAYDAYFGDDWKVRPNFTLSLGLRYEYNTPAEDVPGRMSVLDMNTWAVIGAGTNGTPAGGVNPDYNNFAPRIGFSWSPQNILTVRGGYGLYYDAGMFTVNTAPYFNPPQFTLRVFFPSESGLLTLNNPFVSTNGMTPPASLNVLNPNMSTSYLQHWSLSLERSFGRLGDVSLGYAGSKGTKLTRNSDLNQPAPGPGDAQENRPYPQYAGIMFIDSGACSNYHSLQLRLSRKTNSNLSWWVAYTYSHSIDDASAFLATKPDPNFPQNSNDLRAERASSSFDIRHRLAVAYSYQLPRSYALTRNTEIQGILTASSGQPFTPVLRFDNSNTGNSGGTTGSDRPNLIGNPDLADRTAEQWFNTAAFAIPDRYTFGNAGRNVLRGPGFASFDVSLHRQFALHEQVSLLAEVQAFNLFNRTNFDLPEVYADEPTTFGKILSAKAPRQLQIALRLKF